MDYTLKIWYRDQKQVNVFTFPFKQDALTLYNEMLVRENVYQVVLWEGSNVLSLWYDEERFGYEG